MLQALMEQRIVSLHLSTDDSVGRGRKWRISHELLTCMRSILACSQASMHEYPIRSEQSREATNLTHVRFLWSQTVIRIRLYCIIDRCTFNKLVLVYLEYCDVSVYKAERLIHKR